MRHINIQEISCVYAIVFCFLTMTSIARSEEGDFCKRNSDCYDNIDCTIELCSPILNKCLSTIPVDGLCDDGYFCNGEEKCDLENGCIDGEAPCPGSCDENMNVCESSKSVYEAEEMYHSTGAMIEDGWNIYDEGYVSFNHTFEGGAIDIVVRAKGVYGNGYPKMQITVNGMEVYYEEVNDASWKDYTASFWAPVGTAEIRIYFTNDFYDPPVDRDLHIDKATIRPGGSDTQPINLGPVNTETLFTLEQSAEFVIDEFDFINWNPSKIIIGIGPVDNIPMDGMSLTVDDASTTNLRKYWQQIEVPFTNQSNIVFALSSSSTRSMRVTWWASN